MQISIDIKLTDSNFNDSWIISNKIFRIKRFVHAEMSIDYSRKKGETNGTRTELLHVAEFVLQSFRFTDTWEFNDHVMRDGRE